VKALGSVLLFIGKLLTMAAVMFVYGVAALLIAAILLRVLFCALTQTGLF
jgi:hypothetical protein